MEREPSILKDSIFNSISNYFKGVFKGAWSIRKAAFTTFPYLFGVGELRKEITEQYPDPVSSRTEDDLPPRTRGLLENDPKRCTGCGKCVEVCPVDCILLETDVGPDGSNSWVSKFDIDFGKCIFCGFCTEICPTGSLTHTKRFEGSTYVRADLVDSFGKGKVTPEQKRVWLKTRPSTDYE